MPGAAARQRVDADAHVASRLVASRLVASRLVASRLVAPWPATRAGAVLAALEQRGGARVRLPRTRGPALEAVTVNTAGGLTGDDRIGWSARAGAGSRLVVASAACEKAYRSHGPEACQDTVLAVEPGARLDWLPQETIVQEGARLRRTLEADLEGDGALLACEAVVLGRAAMGERVESGTLHDRWRIRRDGRLVHAEALALGPDVEAAHADAAGLGRYRAFATVVLADERTDVERGRLVERVGAIVREAVGTCEGRANARASALPGRVVLRALATDSRSLRRVLVPALEELGDGRALPRVWHV